MNLKEYLDNAIRTGKTITIKYSKYDGEQSVRQISNIQYSDEFGENYIEAFCHKRQENRTFKISRILSIEDIADIPLSSSSVEFKDKPTQAADRKLLEGGAMAAIFGPLGSRSSFLKDQEGTERNSIKTPSSSPSVEKKNKTGLFWRLYYFFFNIR